MLFVFRLIRVFFTILTSQLIIEGLSVTQMVGSRFSDLGVMGSIP